MIRTKSPGTTANSSGMFGMNDLMMVCIGDKPLASSENGFSLIGVVGGLVKDQDSDGVKGWIKLGYGRGWSIPATVTGSKLP